MIDEWITTDFEKRQNRRQSNQKHKDKYWLRSRQRDAETSFRCLGCQSWVMTDFLLSGVRNRNHCPYCLCSRHLDWAEPGDRLAVCKALMVPVGLTFKKNIKKYTADQAGELMLVHQCQGCGKMSLNRVAADDDAEKLLDLLGPAGWDLDQAAQPGQNWINLLGADYLQRVRRLLYGAKIEPA